MFSNRLKYSNETDTREHFDHTCVRDLCCFGLVAFPTLGMMYATSVSSLYFAVDNLLDMISELSLKVST